MSRSNTQIWINIGSERPASELTLPEVEGATVPRLLHEGPNRWLCVGPSPYRGVWIARRANLARLAMYRWASRASDVDGSTTRMEESVLPICPAEHFDEKKHVRVSIWRAPVMLVIMVYAIIFVAVWRHTSVPIRVQELRCPRVLVTGGVATCVREP